MNRLPEMLARKLDWIAALPQTPLGTVERLASEYKRTPGDLRAMISQRRHGKYGRAMFLPPELRTDYLVLRQHGYRRADAVAALGWNQQP